MPTVGLACLAAFFVSVILLLPRSQSYSFAFSLVAAITAVVVRLRLHRMHNQQRANFLWARCVVLGSVTVWCTHVVRFHIHPPEACVAHVVVLRAVLYVIIPVGSAARTCATPAPPRRWGLGRGTC